MINKQIVENAYRDLGRPRRVVSNREVYDWLENNHTLTDRELEESPHQGRPRYVHSVRTYISALQREGKLERTGRGEYIYTG